MLLTNKEASHEHQRDLDHLTSKAVGISTARSVNTSMTSNTQ